MKKLLIGILFLGLTNLAFAQASSEDGSYLELVGITVMPANMGYLTNVMSGAIKTIKVVRLQEAVASYDIAKSSFYKGKGEFYNLTFNHGDGKVLATFNSNGKILRSHERYNDIVCPPSVREALYTTFPGWNMEANTYIVSYTSGKKASKKLKVILEKDGKKKRIKMNTQGNVL